jgi:hypothetical protein
MTLFLWNTHKMTFFVRFDRLQVQPWTISRVPAPKPRPELEAAVDVASATHGTEQQEARRKAKSVQDATRPALLSSRSVRVALRAFTMPKGEKKLRVASNR